MRALKTKLRRGVQNGNARSDSRYTNLIVQLKDLENINNIHMHYIDWLRSKWSIVRLPTLFSEIFDIPISSKSSTSSAISESIGDESLVNDFEDSGTDESSVGKEICIGDNGNNLMNLRDSAIAAGATTVITTTTTATASTPTASSSGRLMVYENNDVLVATNQVSTMNNSIIHLDQNNHLHNHDHIHQHHQVHHQDHHQNNLLHNQSDEDFFFNLTSFRDADDDKIDAEDLNPTVNCSDVVGVVVDQLTSQ